MSGRRASARKASQSDTRDNIVPLDEATRQRLESRRQPPSQILRMRRDVALMQGYADMLGYLPREQQVAVLRIIARKGQELSETLRPLLEQYRAGERATVDEYRDTLQRTKVLLAEYRQILDGLKQRKYYRASSAPPRGSKL